MVMYTARRETFESKQHVPKVNKPSQFRNIDTCLSYFSISSSKKRTKICFKYNSSWHLAAFRRCGSSSKNPEDLQCVPLNECNKEVYSHFKSLKIGSDEAICDEMALLLARAATVSRLND